MPLRKKATDWQRKLVTKFVEGGIAASNWNNPRMMQRVINAMYNVTRERLVQLGDKFSSAAERIQESKFLENFKRPKIPKNASTEYMNSMLVQMRQAYEHFARFLRSPSSKIENLEKIEREQDARIFGVDEAGNPLKTMTDEERKALWKGYNRFKEMYGSNISVFYQMVRVDDGAAYREVSLTQEAIANWVQENQRTPDLVELQKIYRELEDRVGPLLGAEK